MIQRRQLITIGVLGQMRSLDFKNRGINLRKFGAIEVERTTEIEWSKEHQLWYIRFLRLGKFSGKVLDCGIAWLANLSEQFTALCEHDENGVLLFQNYDDAVTVEVETIQNLRSGKYV